MYSPPGINRPPSFNKDILTVETPSTSICTIIIRATPSSQFDFNSIVTFEQKVLLDIESRSSAVTSSGLVPTIVISNPSSSVLVVVSGFGHSGEQGNDDDVISISERVYG